MVQDTPMLCMRYLHKLFVINKKARTNIDSGFFLCTPDGTKFEPFNGRFGAIEPDDRGIREKKTVLSVYNNLALQYWSSIFIISYPQYIQPWI